MSEQLKHDFEMQALILKTLKQHRRPVWYQGQRHHIACPCGWDSPEGRDTRYNRFLNHQAFEVEAVLTKWIEEEWEEVA